MTRIVPPLGLAPIVFGLAAAALCGCVTLAREDAPPPAAPRDAAPPGFANDIRIVGADPKALAGTHRAITRMKAAARDGSADVLALSGGGAGGAFGAGALIGWTETGRRPTFEAVTGVSTGALIAPFAFLGKDWDGELKQAFTGDDLTALLTSRNLDVLFRPGIFRGEPLFQKVDGFVTPKLIEAVAKESANGRLLLVATTNLDLQQTVLWDMGAIARRGGERARTLFRDVLIASASIPGVFPPVMIDVQAGGSHYQEMHVDGGATVPFFVEPELWALWSGQTEDLRGVNLYVLVNGQIEANPRATPVNTLPIFERAFDTMLMVTTRDAVIDTASFAEKFGVNYRFTHVPASYPYAGPLAFGKKDMASLFAFGERCAREGELWARPRRLIEEIRETEARGAPAQSAAPPCPAAPLKIAER